MTIGRSGYAMAALLALAGCSAPAPAPEPAGAAKEEPAAPSAPPSLYGRWQIVEVDGVAARGFGVDPDQLPHVSFAPGRYGGSSGCNSFGGNGLLEGSRWFAEPPMATQQGCGELTRQESAVFAILASGPSLRWEGPDAASLRSASGSLRLRRSAAAPSAASAEPAPLIAGTRWDLSALDGAGIDSPGARAPARLTLEADAWTLDTPCATSSGEWRQDGDALLLEPGRATARACPAGLEAPSKRLIDAISGRLRFVTGANGELVMTDGRHWLTGSRDLTFDPGRQASLSGRWRVVAVDGRAPPAGERPAELAFGPGAYAVWDGCRHSEGVAIVEDGQLFTLGSGVVTLANCPADAIRATIAAVVAGEPRIASTGEGIALVSRAGTLRLQRAASAPFGSGVETRLRSGLAFQLAAQDGTGARLTLGPGDLFTVALACGRFDGRWRNASGGGYARFGPDRPPAGCGEEPGRIYNFFTGDVRVAIGPNRDIALFVNRGERLAGRPAGGAAAPR